MKEWSLLLHPFYHLQCRCPVCVDMIQCLQVKVKVTEIWEQIKEKEGERERDATRMRDIKLNASLTPHVMCDLSPHILIFFSLSLSRSFFSVSSHQAFTLRLLSAFRVFFHPPGLPVFSKHSLHPLFLHVWPLSFYSLFILSSLVPAG